MGLMQEHDTEFEEFRVAFSAGPAAPRRQELSGGATIGLYPELPQILCEGAGNRRRLVPLTGFVEMRCACLRKGLPTG